MRKELGVRILLRGGCEPWYTKRLSSFFLLARACEGASHHYPFALDCRQPLKDAAALGFTVACYLAEGTVAGF